MDSAPLRLCVFAELRNTGNRMQCSFGSSSLNYQCTKFWAYCSSDIKADMVQHGDFEASRCGFLAKVNSDMLLLNDIVT